MGRLTELGRLEAAFEDVIGGRPSVVLVGGDAGIGKSRLVEEFCDRARLGEATVLSGACVPGDGGLPYAPVVGVLRGLTEQLASSERVELFAFVGGSTGPPPAGEPDQPAGIFDSLGATYGKTALFEQILGELIEAARRGPLVVAVEDLQWCDSSSAQLLDYVVRNLADARVMLLFTYRSEEFGSDHPLRPWLTELGRFRSAAHLRLEGLARTDLAALIKERTGDALVDTRIESLWSRTQGNPFYTEELLSTADPDELPAELQAIILFRVRQLSRRSQQVLALVAAAGMSIEDTMLTALFKGDDETLAADLADAIDNHILVATRQPPAYRFRHALLREAVHTSMLPAQQRAAHRRIATLLEADPSIGASPSHQRLAELAGHWWAAGDWACAVPSSIAAAEAAASVFAFGDAHTHLEHAISASARMADGDSPAGGVDLLERAADYAYYAGENLRALELARQATAAALEADDPRAAARCYTLAGRSAWGAGDSAAAFEAYRRAIELLPQDEPSTELAAALAEEARGLLLMSRFEGGRERAQQAIVVAQAAGSRQVEGHARCTLGTCLGALGWMREGIEVVQSAIVIAEDLASPDDLNRGYANLSYLLVASERYEEAADLVFDAAAMGEELGGIRLNGAIGNAACALVFLGRWEEAERMLDQGGISPIGSCIPGPYSDRLPVAIRQGDFERAASLLETAHELTDGLADVQFSATFHAFDAELALELGEPDRAAEAIQRALVLTDLADEPDRALDFLSKGIRGLADLAAASLTSERDDMRVRADELLATAEAAAAVVSRRAEPSWRPVAIATICAAEHTRLDHSDPALWRQAGDQLAAVPDAYLTAYCRWREAEALLESRGSRARAQECLSMAVQTASQLHAKPLTARIQALAQRSRVDLIVLEARNKPVPAEHVGTALGLTPREVQILGQLAVGRTDQEIADEFFISKKTVSVHVSNILRKLRVANRIEAGRIGQTHGLSVRPATEVSELP